MNSANVKTAADTHEMLELVDQTTPLVTLQSDIDNLHNCLNSYQDQLSVSMHPGETPQRWGGMRLSKTTAVIFGTVVLFTLLVNCALTILGADHPQMLQANVGIGVLYALVSMAVLNDMSGSRNPLRSEGEALQLRILDVTDQFRELLRTRHAWVEESTRTQWLCETDKLKLQLATQELQTTSESIDQHRETLDVLKVAIAGAEAQSAKLAQEVAARNEQLSGQQSKIDSAIKELQSTEKQHDSLRMQVEAGANQLATLQSQITQLQEQMDTQSQTLAAELDAARCHADEQMAAANAQAIQAQQDLDRLHLNLATSRDEVSLCEGILQEQSQKLTAVNRELESNEVQLIRLAADLAAKSQEYEDILGKSEQASARKLECDDEVTLLSQELVALRQQKENYAAEVAQLTTDRDARLVESEALHARTEICRNSLESLTNHTQQQQELYSQQQQRIDEQIELASRHEFELLQLQQQERDVQDKVDWLLSQLGELERLALAQLANEPAAHEPNAREMAAHELAFREPVELDQCKQCAQRADQDADLAQREATIASLQVEELRLEMSIAELRHQVESLGGDCQVRTEQLKELTSQSKHLASEVEQMRLLTDECRDEFSEQTAALRQQMAERQSQLDECHQTLALRQEEFDSLNKAMAEAQEQHSETLKQLQIHASELREIQTLLQEAQQSYESTVQGERAAEERATLLLEKAESIAEQVRVRSIELDETARELNALETEIRNLEALKAQFDQISGDSDRLESRLEQQRGEAIDLAASIENHRNLESELHSEIARLTQHVHALNQEVEVAGDQATQRTSQLDSMRAEMAELDHSHCLLDAEMTQLQNLLDSKSRELRSIESQVGEQLAELERHHGERASLQTVLDELRENVVELDLATVAGQNRLHDLTELIQKREAEFIEAQQLLEEQVAHENAVEARTQTMLAEEARLRSRVASLTSEVNESQAIASQWQEYLTKLKGELERLESEKVTGQHALEDVHRRLALQQDAHESLATRLRLAQDQLSDAENEFYRLEKQTGELQSDIVRLEGQRSNVRQEVRQAEATLESLNHERSTLQHALVDARQQLQSEQAAVQKSIAEAERALSDIDLAEQREHELQLAIDALLSQRAELESQVDQLEQAVATLSTQRDVLQGEAGHCTEELARLRTERDQAQVQFDLISQELATTLAQLQTSIAEYEQRQASLCIASNQLTELEDLLQDVNEQVLAKTKEMSACAVELSNQREAVAVCLKQFESMQDEIDLLREEDGALGLRRAEFSQVMTEQKAEMAKLILHAKHANSGMKRLRSAAEAKQSQLARLEAEIVRGNEELQRNLMRLEDLRAEANEAETRLTEQEMRSQKVELQINDKLLALASSEQRIESSKAAKASLERHLGKLTASHVQAVEELKQIEMKSAEIQAEQVRQTEALRQELAGLVSEREQLCREEFELRASIAQLKESLASASLAASSSSGKDEPVTDVSRERLGDPLETVPQSVSELAPADTLEAESEMPIVADDRLVADVWSSVQELSQMVHDSRLNESVANLAAGGLDPWATVLADVSHAERSRKGA